MENSNRSKFKSTLVVAPHADDEILGAGGAMARWATEGEQVYVLVVTKGRLPLFSEAYMANVRSEALAAHKILGVKETIFLDFPAAELGSVLDREINAAIGDVVERVRPDRMLIPFVGDIHRDHQIIFWSSMVASRPNKECYPQEILAYETLSETNWSAPSITPQFAPNVFIDISDFLEKKIQALDFFKSQMREFPNERSVEAVRALAQLRGASVHRKAAESFALVRRVH